MKILYVVPYIPSLIRVRPFNLIRFLSEQGHQVTVAALWNNEQEKQDAQTLRQYCQTVESMSISRLRSYANSAAALPTRTPLQAVYSWSPAFAHHLDKLVRSGGYDIVHIEHLRGVRYGLDLQKKHPNMPIVWDSVDCISLLFRWAAQHSRSLFGRWLTRFEVGRTERYEGRLVGCFDRVLVTSPIDRQALVDLAPNPESVANISVLTNGVNLEYFRPNDDQQRSPATLVVSGKMSYHANITMVLFLAQEIMPIVWHERSDVRLQIVGKDPSPEIQVLGKQNGIEVVGSVPDIRPYLQQATLAVTPILYGVGIQNKVLEALACATPIVSSPQAVSAINVKNGQDIMIAKEPNAYANAILQLLSDPDKRQQIGNAGRKFVEKNHQWAGITADLTEIYKEVCHKRGLV